MLKIPFCRQFLHTDIKTVYLKINDKHQKIISMHRTFTIAKTFYSIMKIYIANNFVLAIIGFIKSNNYNLKEKCIDQDYKMNNTF